MTLRPDEINHEFIERCRQFVEDGSPAGQAPDLCRFPDRALAMSGWTLGHFPRVDCMTGKVLEEGEESMHEEHRRVAREMGWLA